MKIVPFASDDVHADVPRLLPWYASGELEPDEAARVQLHLAGCAQCQAELAAERRLHAAAARVVAEDAAGGAVPLEQGWRAMKARIAVDAPRAVPGGPAGRAAAMQRMPSWLPWAFAGQFALIFAFFAWIVLPRPDGAFQALGRSTPRDAANAIVMFRPQASEAALRSALRAVGARLAGGPTAADAYLVILPPATAASALAQLRANPAVSLAEPLQAGP